MPDVSLTSKQTSHMSTTHVFLTHSKVRDQLIATSGVLTVGSFSGSRKNERIRRDQSSLHAASFAYHARGAGLVADFRSMPIGRNGVEG